jgi:DNA repair exonuclease SbcCD ATPase subunit
VDHEKMTPGVVAEAIEKARIELLHQGPWESIRESERTARLRVLLSAMENAGVLDGLATLRERSARLSTVTDDLAAARTKLGGIEAAHTAELADIEAAHAAEIADVRAAHAAELTDTQDQLHQSEARATDLDTQLTEARQTLTDTQAAHAAELTDVRAAHAAELADVRAAHAAELTAADEHHRRETDEHTAALDALRTELTDTQAAHAAELADASGASLDDQTEPHAADTPAPPRTDEPAIAQPPVESLSLLRRILTGSLRSAPDAEGRHREQPDVTRSPPHRSEP